MFAGPVTRWAIGPDRKLVDDAVLAFMRRLCIFWIGDRFFERRCDSSGVD
jgi:hypothetical protein